jgi:hypothetical protein
MTVEQQIGTVRMFWRFLTLGLIVNTVFSLLCVAGGFKQMSIGLWPLVFTEITIQCMQNPDSSRP